MTRSDLRSAVEAVFQEALTLHAGKNRGYAFEEDGLSNFKKAASRSRQTPLQYLWTLNSKQILAIEEAIFDGKEVTYEGVEDKLLDNIVYSAIALAMLRVPIDAIEVGGVPVFSSSETLESDTQAAIDSIVPGTTTQAVLNALNIPTNPLQNDQRPLHERLQSKLASFFSKEPREESNECKPSANS